MHEVWGIFFYKICEEMNERTRCYPELRPLLNAVVVIVLISSQPIP